MEKTGNVYLDHEVRPHNKNNQWRQREKNKNKTQYTKLYLLFDLAVMLFVQNIFSININGWAHAEKFLTGWTRPLT